MANKKIPVLTIDGPAGSGKGTISQRVATQLGWHLLDSGALYRLVALAADKKQLLTDAVANENKISELAKQLDIRFLPVPHQPVKILLEGKDVTQKIRTENCGNQASIVAALPDVRTALLERQRQFLELPGLVADGRDMGTIVFPDAATKIFLTASPEIRANRRLEQLKNQGINANLHGLIRDIEERDERDTKRKDAPLVPAQDATIIDTGEATIDDVVNRVMRALHASSL